MNGYSILDALAIPNWPTLVLVSARMVGLMLVAPLWAMAGVPKVVRGAIVIVFTFGILPTVRSATIPSEFLAIPIPLVSELLLGLAVGLCGAIFMAGVSMAGEVASLQMGLNLGPALTPMAEGTVTGVGELKQMLALALYVTLGGHLMLLKAVVASFHAIAPGGIVDYPQGGRLLVALGGTLFTTAVRVAAPVIVALLLANLGLAILSRAVPQLNAMAVAFPITIGIGFLLLGAAVPFIGTYIGEWVIGGLPRATGAVINGFVPVPGTR